MIVEWFLNLFYHMIGFLLTPIQMIFQPLGSVAGLMELLATASIFLPLSTLGTCLGIWLAYHAVRFAIVLANWVIGKIPTVS